MSESILTESRASKNGEARPEPKKVSKSVTIDAPNLQIAMFKVRGESPYMQNKFSNKARQMMMEKQAAGDQAKKGKKREAKDFDACYEQAQYRSREGWNGIPAGAFRTAMISACRTVNFKMTVAKLSVFIMPDGFDADEGTPLVKIIGKPKKHLAAVRNESGVADIRARPMWEEWSANLRVRYDADQFSLDDVASLLLRAGLQVGIGEGRHDSSASTGCGFGTFSIDQEASRVESKK